MKARRHAARNAPRARAPRRATAPCCAAKRRRGLRCTCAPRNARAVPAQERVIALYAGGVADGDDRCPVDDVLLIATPTKPGASRLASVDRLVGVGMHRLDDMHAVLARKTDLVARLPRQQLIKLLSNAFKSTERSGRIDIACKVVWARPSARSAMQSASASGAPRMSQTAALSRSWRRRWVTASRNAAAVTDRRRSSHDADRRRWSSNATHSSPGTSRRTVRVTIVQCDLLGRNLRTLNHVRHVADDRLPVTIEACEKQIGSQRSDEQHGRSAMNIIAIGCTNSDDRNVSRMS